jgi:predicted dehydrogenase
MPTPKKTLNIAMIGDGFIGKAHSNAFHQVGRFFEVPYALNLKLVCARDRGKLESFAQQWSWQETTNDWRQAIDRKDIDVVDIAVPNALHAPIALAAAGAGKIVWCEKPLAASLREAREMAAAVGRRPNLVWFNYRRAPAVAFAKQIIEQGKLGEPYHYRAYYFNQSGTDPSKGKTWRYKKDEAGSGAIGDLLSHSLDTAFYLNGGIASLSATKHTFMPGREVDDAVSVMARFTNGSLGSFEASRFGVGRRNGNGFEFYGSRGSLSFDLEEMNRLRFFDVTEVSALQAWRDILVTGPDHPYSANFWKPGHIVGYEHTFIATLGDFLQKLAKNEAFSPDFQDATKVQAVLEAVELSSQTGVWTAIPELGSRG